MADKKTPLWLTSIQIITLGAAAATAFIAVIEYRSAQRWKMAELASRELAQPHEDPMLATALLMLDWDNRLIDLPEAYRDTGEATMFHHTSANLVAAFRHAAENHVSGELDGVEIVFYVDVFDRLFRYFDRIDHLIGIGLIRERDVAPLCYWTQAVENHPFEGTHLTFEAYMDKFEKNAPGAKPLIRRLHGYCHE